MRPLAPPCNPPPSRGPSSGGTGRRPARGLPGDIAAASDVHENVDLPLAPFLYTVSCMHCMTVSLAQGGAGLGAMWGEQTAHAMLAEAGFTQVEVKRIEDDPFNAYYVATKG